MRTQAKSRVSDRVVLRKMPRVDRHHWELEWTVLKEFQGNGGLAGALI